MTQKSMEIAKKVIWNSYDSRRGKTNNRFNRKRNSKAKKREKKYHNCKIYNTKIK